MPDQKTGHVPPDHSRGVLGGHSCARPGNAGGHVLQQHHIGLCERERSVPRRMDHPGAGPAADGVLHLHRDQGEEPVDSGVRAAADRSHGPVPVGGPGQGCRPGGIRRLPQHCDDARHLPGRVGHHPLCRTLHEERARTSPGSSRSCSYSSVP